MYKPSNIILLTLRKIFTKIFSVEIKEFDRGITDPNKASDLIYNLLASGKPCMIARYGAFELASVINYLGVKNAQHSCLKYITGHEHQWWWNKRLMGLMQSNAGFFPSTEENLMKFGELMIEDSKLVDILGSWQHNEIYLNEYLKNATKIHFQDLEPFWSERPWTRVLKGKKILVVHPFFNAILQQYPKRKKLFINQEILPEFKSLEVIPAVQSIGGYNSKFSNWFDALDYMKKEIGTREFDICLIGCGAYGFPLAAYVKKIGKQAVHLGGVLQLLFGIKGNRWENPNYGVKEWGIPYGSYSNLINDFWIKPSDKEKPQQSDQVEGACYW